MKQETWVHAEADIRSNGRCQVKTAPAEGDEAAADDDEAKGEQPSIEEMRNSFFQPFGAAAAAAVPDSDFDGVKLVPRSIVDDQVTGLHWDQEGGKHFFGVGWTLRQCPSGAGATPLNTVVVAKSFKWPGAIAVAAGFGEPQPLTKGRRRVTNV